MSEATPVSASAGSRAALVVLVLLVVLSPWPFGSVHLRTTEAIALVSLATALGAFLWDCGRGQLCLPPRGILWPLLGLWTLAAFQLIPLPEALHQWIAPGSVAIWHPDVPAAAAVLGSGPHPISLYPEATCRWLAFVTGLVALSLAAAPALGERRLLRRASTAIVAGAVFVAIYGFVARLVFGERLFGVWSVPTVAPFGPFVSKNHFAGYAELAALLALGLATGLADEARRGWGWLSWIESHRSKWVVVAWGAALVLVLAVPASLSRGGVVSLCAGLIVFGLLRLWAPRTSRLSLRGLAAAFAVALLAAAAVTALLPTEARGRVLTLAGVSSDQSGAYRIAVWRDTLRLIASSPVVGSGFGAYADSFPRFKTAAGHLGVEHAESDHLEFLAEGGGLGALLGEGSALVLFLYGLRGLRTEERLLTRALLAAALAGGAAIYIHSAFEFNLHIPSNALLAAFLAALEVAGARSAEGPGTARTRGFGSWSGFLVLASSLLIAVLTPWSEPRWHSAALARAAVPSPTELRRSSLESDVIALLRRRPGQAAAWVDLGWLRFPRIRDEARALAEWGVALDPQHAQLARASAPLREAAR
jgi:O-antigen ligase